MIDNCRPTPKRQGALQNSKALNYRPLSLTSICYKICEHILASSIRKYLSYDNILHGSQHGFRIKRSWETQLIIIIIQNLAELVANGNQIDIIISRFYEGLW